MKIDDITGEVLEENTVNYQLAIREFNSLQVIDEWLERKEALETAKEQFEMVDKPFRRKMKEIFEKYGITRLYNDYLDVSNKNGYTRESWDDEKLTEFIIKNGGDPKQFKTGKWINGTIQIKYK